MSITAGFYSDEPRQTGYTDSNGLFVAECKKAMLGQGSFSVGHNIPGYYETHSGYRFTKIINGRYEPWDPVVTAVVRRIINPIPMYVRKVDTQIPILDEYVGYDLMKGDWIAPYGKGESPDFLFTMKNRFEDIHHFDTSLELTLTNAVDGIQETSLSVYQDSEFRLAKLAPLDGYTTTFQESESGTNYFKPNFDQSFLFRVRSVTNSAGKIVSAYYGKIRSCIGFAGRRSKTGSVHFTYYLNPTPNDRNLEFDPKRNLFKNLKSTEQVTVP